MISTYRLAFEVVGANGVHHCSTGDVYAVWSLLGEADV